MSDDRAKVEAALADDSRPPSALIDDYRGGVGLLRAALSEMKPEHLGARPIPGKMSTQEVVCHLADCDQFLADRMKRTIAMDRPLLMGADGNRYIKALHYADRDIHLDLVLLEITRRQMAADLERLGRAAWDRTAIHSEIGLVTLRQLLLHAIRHLEHHVRAIEEKRRALGLE